MTSCAVIVALIRLDNFDVTLHVENSPGDARKLIDEREHVAVQPLLGRLDPGHPLYFEERVDR